jgi:hypothetical protein
MFFGIFFINYKVYMFKVWHKSKMFLHVQRTQISKVNNFYFFKHFFNTKCAPLLLSIEEEFNIDD